MPNRSPLSFHLLQLVVLCGAAGSTLAESPITESAITDSPLADAAARGDLEAVRSLLRGGADVDAPQGDGMTALHWAAERDAVEMLRTLVAAGANLSATTRIGAYTALHLASRAGIYVFPLERKLEALDYLLVLAGVGMFLDVGQVVVAS